MCDRVDLAGQRGLRFLGYSGTGPEPRGGGAQSGRSGRWGRGLPRGRDRPSVWGRVESSFGDVDGPLGAGLGRGGRAEEVGWAGGGGISHWVGVVRFGGSTFGGGAQEGSGE